MKSQRLPVAVAMSLLVAPVVSRSAYAQRVLGLDVSRYQGEISQTRWDNLLAADNRQFVFIRSSRGGSTGEDHRQGGYASGDTFFDLSQRYDDPNFIQNITRATHAGLFAGPYHFARLDVIASTPNTGGIANNGADEADHFMQTAGAFMRPGYLMPTYDLESGQGARSANQIAQYSLDFSNRIYNALGIRPTMYINGNYSNILQSASLALRDQLANPTTNLQPSVIGPAFPTVWTARYATSPDVQVDHPKDTASTFYGPWDDYGDSHPWNFWQYTSSGNLQGIAPLDLNVSHGDIEYLKDSLVPAVWVNDSSGDWSTLANWNSGQPAIVPIASPGQLPALASGPLPTPRLAGAPGPGVTGGENDTVILERPNADITITHSTGTTSVRKLYVREALDITGGSLTVNYDPDYAVPTDIFGSSLYPGALRSGQLSAQFSAPVTLSGAGTLNVNTLSVDPEQTFTVAGGNLSFNRIHLSYGMGAAGATIALSSDLDVTPPTGKTASIVSGFGFGFAPSVNLTGESRTINVADGSADVDLDISVGITNGALVKAGPGTLQLSYYSSYAGTTTVNGGRLVVSGSTGTGDVDVNAGAEITGYGYIPGNLVLNGLGAKRTGDNYISGNATVNAGAKFAGGGTVVSNLTANGGAIAPADGAIGNLFTYGDLELNNGSTYEYDYNATTLAADSMFVSNALNLAGAVNLNLNNLDSGVLPRNTKFTLVNYGGAWNGGAFNGHANNSVFGDGENLYRIQYDDVGTYYVNSVTLTTLSGPVAGFVDEYAPEHWTTEDANAHGGYVDTGAAPYYLTIFGPEDRSREPGQIAFLITLPASGMLSFDWYYYNADLPGFDVAYFINGVETLLANIDGSSGHVAVEVHAGDTLGWRIASTDAVGGAGTLQISNFLAPGLPVVPEPAIAGILAMGIGMLGAKRLRRRRR